MIENQNQNSENEQRETPSEAHAGQETAHTASPAQEIAPTEEHAAVGENGSPEGSKPTDESVPAEQPTPAAPTVIYRWDYAEQRKADETHARKDRRGGAWTFGIVMSVCFAVALIALFLSLGLGGFDFATPDEDYGTDQPSNDDSWRDSFDYGNELDSEPEGALTLQEISARGNRVVVAISVKTPLGAGSGSGIILTEDGYIATNAHVVNGATEVSVQTYDGKEYAAEVIGSSVIDDLAVLKIEATELPVARFGNSADVMVGDRAVVIGHPAGLEFGWTSTYGYISAINRDVKIRDYDGTLIKKMTLIQTDANVNKGNSGGPMFNSRGEVIGIITMKLMGDYEGMGFAIPSNGALPLLDALMKTGTTDGVESDVSTQRPQLGITGVSVEAENWYALIGGYYRILTEEQAASVEGSFYASATGVYIRSVSEASDSYGKIEVGDVITALDGHKMNTIEKMREYLYDLRVGDTVEITYVRDGEESTIAILLTPPEDE